MLLWAGLYTRDSWDPLQLEWSCDSRWVHITVEVTSKIFEPYGSTYQPLRSDPGTASHQLDSHVTDDYPLSPAVQLNCLLFQLIFSQPANETAMKNGAKASLVFHGLMCSSVSSFCMHSTSLCMLCCSQSLCQAWRLGFCACPSFRLWSGLCRILLPSTIMSNPRLRALRALTGSFTFHAFPRKAPLFFSYMCTAVPIHKCRYAHTCTLICTYACTHMHICSHSHVHMDTQPLAHMDTGIHMHAHWHMYVLTQEHIHIDTYM